jgi:hypothetical protein
MKYIIVEFADAADLAAAGVGSVIEVKKDATVIPGGKVVFLGVGSNPPPASLPAHTHPVTGVTGNPG